MSKESFAFFNEKLLVDDIKFISWCPTADLVLLVSPNDTLSLFRSGEQVQKIWSLKNTTHSEIRIITWKPNGKEFVVGCINGFVYKVDIADHTPKMSPCWSPSPPSSSITTLVWINYEYKKKQMDIEGFDVDVFDLESALPLLSTESPEEPVSHLPVSRRKKVQLPTQPLHNAEIQTLLFIGNASGQIHIILNGIYPIGSIVINEEEEQNPIILDISIQHNVSSVQILAKSPATENFILYSMDTQFLEEKKEEIFGISKIQTKLNYLLEYTRITLDVLKRHHASYSRLTSNIAKRAADYIIQENEHATAMPEVELTGTLAIGSVTEPLREFFVDYLTSQYIKQWETNTTHGHQNSLRVVCEHILPACERIQLELSKLLGYSLWTQRFGDFLEKAAVEDCIRHIRKLVSQIHLFTKDLNSLIVTFQAFIKWITVVSQRVADPNSVEFQNETSLCEDPELVLKFLNTDFIQDSLANYFVSPFDAASKKEDKLKPAFNKNLIDLLERTTACCGEMLQKPSETISKKMTMASKTHFQLDGVSMENQPRDKVISFTTIKTQEDEQCIYYAFLLLNPDPKLIILKSDFVGDSVTQYALFNIDQGNIVTDMEFFDDKELGICIQTDRSTTSLATISLESMEFRNLSSTELASEDFGIVRSLELQNMKDVKFGCNGLPRRRILCVGASNGLIKVYSMEEEEEEEDEEDDEEEKDDEDQAMSE